ncbi:aminotransferase class V-fold PLP-dependent enzyme [Sphingomonas radiodurans]|uniref:aminotransferase class V-fold PLP-dependent enzyme n=1 Tax=Sphingomonas radiodurans TaxID=2890321 RepID=UPI001E44826A|nr:aminotransferase class V-fold PLP-dependent enzyme [Sphingomonas radiodurans]WBH17864.1 aminotransferase class V-fold PLP-dependent enzyme [Sphingomonas radiodurans]
MQKINRRMMLAGGLAFPAAAGAALAPGDDDERFWSAIAAEYAPPAGVIQLENGNWGMMARPVLQAYQELVARVNRDTSFYARRGMTRDLMAARDQAAAAMGVPADEIAFTRNASEALRALILGYNRLTPGDAVLYADLDYDAMQTCMESLATQRRARVVRIALPEPATRQTLIDTYVAAMAANPRLKLILLTHLSHRTGLVVPVREIAGLARARGIDVIVDAAHSWGQLDFTLRDLDCDFVGVNGHKWLGAPLGVAFLHIRKAALDRIDRDPLNEAGGHDGIHTRVHLGTYDFAASLTVPAALAFQARIGSARRAARLRMLRDRWVTVARTIPGLDVLTPDDPTMHGAITSFRVRGITDSARNARLAKWLLDERGIFTVQRDGVAGGACVRVTPAVYTRVSDVDALAAALPGLMGFSRTI